MRGQNPGFSSRNRVSNSPQNSIKLTRSAAPRQRSASQQKVAVSLRDTEPAHNNRRPFRYHFASPPSPPRPPYDGLPGPSTRPPALEGRPAAKSSQRSTKPGTQRIGKTAPASSPPQTRCSSQHLTHARFSQVDARSVRGPTPPPAALRPHTFRSPEVYPLQRRGQEIEDDCQHPRPPRNCKDHKQFPTTPSIKPPAPPTDPAAAQLPQQQSPTPNPALTHRRRTTVGKRDHHSLSASSRRNTEYGSAFSSLISRPPCSWPT